MLNLHRLHCGLVGVSSGRGRNDTLRISVPSSPPFQLDQQLTIHLSYLLQVSVFVVDIG